MIIFFTIDGSFRLLCASSFTYKDAEVEGQTEQMQIALEVQNWVHSFYSISYEKKICWIAQQNRKSSGLVVRIKWLLLTQNWCPGQEQSSQWAATMLNVTIHFTDCDLFCVTQQQKIQQRRIWQWIGQDSIKIKSDQSPQANIALPRILCYHSCSFQSFYINIGRIDWGKKHKLLYGGLTKALMSSFIMMVVLSLTGDVTESMLSISIIACLP